jgi:hypothetical protein
MRLVRIAALLLGLLGLLAVPTTNADAGPVTPQSLDGTWACSVPAGYVWDQVANNLGVCSPTGFAPSYHLRLPVDGLWACTTNAPGFVWDQVANNLSVCSPNNFAFSYRLRVPVNGLWACSVPAGFTYDQVANNLSVCSPNGFANSYHLRG